MSSAGSVEESTRPRQANRIPSQLRKWGWNLAFDLTGGISVTGPVPQGPAILVPNHQSHADAAALLAALPSRSRPMMLAAADYWFASVWRRTIVSSLISALPLERSGNRGAYAAMVKATKPVLDGGGVVIIFPEGTRATGDTMARFKTGAIRLAHDLGVPIVPVALLGTREVLPKAGRFRLRPVEVRFAPPFEPTVPIDRTAKSARLAADEIRDLIDRMRQGPIRQVVSPVWRAVAEVVGSRRGLALAFGWGYAEALSWPVSAEMELVCFGAAVPRRTLSHAVALTAGSVAGTMTHVAVARRGARVPMPLVTERMRLSAAASVSRRGLNALWSQPFTGIPVNAYANAVAGTNAPLTKVALMTLAVRGSQMLSFGAVTAQASHMLQQQSQRVWGRWMLGAGVAWAKGALRVRRFWS